MAMEEFLGLVSLIASCDAIPLGRILLKVPYFNEIVNPVPNPSKPPLGRGKIIFCLGSQHLLRVSHLYPWWRFPNSYL